ncbi:unnamed protein product, partial [Brenthis ino]
MRCLEFFKSPLIIYEDEINSVVWCSDVLVPNMEPSLPLEEDEGRPQQGSTGSGSSSGTGYYGHKNG